MMHEYKVIHIVPELDAKEHNSNNSIECHCKPQIERRRDGNYLVIHNAYDGREFYESANIFQRDH